MKVLPQCCCSICKKCRRVGGTVHMSEVHQKVPISCAHKYVISAAVLLAH